MKKEDEIDIQEEKDESEELFEHFKFEVDKGQNLLRVDKYLMNLIPNTTRNKIQNAIKAGNILANNKPTQSNYRVHPYDTISVVLAYPPREVDIIGEDIPLNIVFEDKDIIIINKEAGMVVHPGFGNYQGTLVNALTFYFQKYSHLSEPPKPYLVHRIDKNTTGIMIVAKTEEAQNHLANDFFYHTIDRKYQALVWGDFDEDSGTIIGNLGRSLKDRKIMTVFPDGDYGKHAITHWKVIERFGYVTLIECTLETGRTHQIRAHLQYIKHPLFNDATYGGDRILKGTTFTKYKQFVENCFKILPRHSLHAKSLGITHPITKEKLFFDSELAQDMNTVIEKWRNYSKHKEFV